MNYYLILSPKDPIMCSISHGPECHIVNKIERYVDYSSAFPSKQFLNQL